MTQLKFADDPAGDAVARAGRAYDPVPDLAQLLSGLRMLKPGQYPGDMRAAVSGLIHGPVARLDEGLGLHDPATLAQGTETAIYEALRAIT